MNGITFEDYASVNALLAQGKNLEELLNVLGVTAVEWEEANQYWEKEMANDESFKLMTRFAEIFGNPSIGKFSNLSAQTTQGALQRIDSFEKYIDIAAGMSIASENGMDAQIWLKEQGLTVTDWSQAGMHWGKYHLEEVERLRDDEEASSRFHAWYNETSEKYRAYYDNLYQSK